MAVTIGERAGSVEERIHQACDRAGRARGDVGVVVITKGRSNNDVRMAYDFGFRRFAENRAQALRERHGVLPGDAAWEFVGPLQRNKVRLVRPVVTLLHSMDRQSLADSWLKGPGSAPPVLVQVNVGEEPQKAGTLPGAAHELVAYCESLGLVVAGLMAIPPNPSVPEDSRPYFSALRALRDRLAADHPAVQELSMGMSDDFEVAIEEGATVIRPGRAIFGPLATGSE